MNILVFYKRSWVNLLVITNAIKYDYMLWIIVKNIVTLCVSDFNYEDHSCEGLETAFSDAIDQLALEFSSRYSSMFDQSVSSLLQSWTLIYRWNLQREQGSCNIIFLFQCVRISYGGSSAQFWWRSQDKGMLTVFLYYMYLDLMFWFLGDALDNTRLKERKWNGP